MKSNITATILISIYFIILTPDLILSQAEHFARLSISSDKVITGQPFHVRITVYTPTWFTKAPDFGEYQLRNSFTVRTDRPQSNYETINGIRYTTLYYEYIVFPLKAGKLELPPVDVQFESPAEGDYKGKPVNVTTRGASLEILPIPDHPDNYRLFVANHVSLSESWDKKYSELKVGDVLERSIRISATGTLANMIPPLNLDTVPWASTYTGKASLSQNITDKNLTSERIEKYTYLLEEEGSFILPEVKIDYYNLQGRKWMSRAIPSKEITVVKNPDLYVLKTLQDSLAAGEGILLPNEKKPPEIFGLSLNRFLVLLALFCIAVLVLVFLTKALITWFSAYKSRYLQSENYHFRQLILAIRRQNSKQINEYLYSWLSRLDPMNSFTTVSEFSRSIDDIELADSVNEFHRQEFGDSSTERNIPGGKGIKASLEKQLRSARRTWIQMKKEQEEFNISKYHLSNT